MKTGSDLMQKMSIGAMSIGAWFIPPPQFIKFLSSFFYASANNKIRIILRIHGYYVFQLFICVHKRKRNCKKRFLHDIYLKISLYTFKITSGMAQSVTLLPKSANWSVCGSSVMEKIYALKCPLIFLIAFLKSPMASS